MILTGEEIKKQIGLGKIVIEPFDEKMVNPNSVDLTLNSTIKFYELGEVPGACLDVKKQHQVIATEIKDEGRILYPGCIYIASTNETAISQYYVPKVEGKSSIGRLGLSIHSTAGFGDLGWGWVDQEFYGHNDSEIRIIKHCTLPKWTLELSVIQPVRIYPNMRICQVTFFAVQGEIKGYVGKYNHQTEATESRSYQDFGGKK